MILGINGDNTCLHANAITDVFKANKEEPTRIVMSDQAKFQCIYDYQNNLKPGQTQLYYRQFPGQPTVLAINKTTNYAYISGSNNHMAKLVRTFMNKTMWQRYGHQFEADYIIKTGKLPNGMRTVVDHRYIGGIPPISNGTFNPYSIRRWIRPINTQQIGSTCSVTLAVQTYALTRPTQLGEAARIEALGNVPYCTNIANAEIGIFKRLYTCDASKTQLPFFNYLYSVTQDSKTRRYSLKPKNKVQKETWVPIKDTRYALNTTGHRMKRPVIDLPMDFKYDEGIYESGVDLPTDDKTNFSFNAKNYIYVNTVDDTSYVYRENDRAIAYALYGNKLTPDPYITPLVASKYRLPDQFDWMQARNRSDVCFDNPMNSFNVEGGWSSYATKVLNITHQNGICNDNAVKLLRYNGQLPNLKNRALFGNGTTHSYNAPKQYSDKAEPYFFDKNSGNYLTGDFHRASPAVILMFLLDNYGPIGLDLPPTYCSAYRLKPGLKDTSSLQPLERVIKELGGFEAAAQVLYPDLFMDGYGDSLDFWSRAGAQKVCNAPYLRGGAGSGSGHSVACVGYKWFPHKPEEVTFLLYNSHTTSGAWQRGVFYRTVPLSSMNMAFNGILIINSDFSKFGLPLKYYYDGTEEVPEGAKGNTNEVRGRSKYDWTQTTEYSSDGSSTQGLKLDGTDGKHCGFGNACTTSGDYILKDRKINNYKDDSFRIVPVPWPYSCRNTPKIIKTCKTTQECLGSFYLPNASLITCEFDFTKPVNNSQVSLLLRSSNRDANHFHESTYVNNVEYGMMLPACVETKYTISQTNFKAIGGADLCKNGWMTTMNNLTECSKACEKNSTCTYFSYNFALKQCQIGAALGDYVPSGIGCNEICYKKRVDPNPDVFNIVPNANGFFELGNRFCKMGKQIQQDIYDLSSVQECATFCNAKSECNYFQYDSGRCLLYSECNIAIDDPFLHNFNDIRALNGTVFKPFNKLRLYGKFNLDYSSGVPLSTKAPTLNPVTSPTITSPTISNHAHSMGVHLFIINILLIFINN